ncbi:MAG: M23 family metallopeptidase [Prochloraceae cyanobacterium]|nr:M23 family metallopeptidase [Prochloraceae cyanobacterium]
MKLNKFLILMLLAISFSFALHLTTNSLIKDRGTKVNLTNSLRPPPALENLENNYAVGGEEIARGEIKIASSVLIAANSAAWGYGSFPVENFVRYTSTYGYRINPVTKKRRFHRGIDMAAPLGSGVRAWWGGQIIKFTDSKKGCGTGVIIASGNWQHIYCHLKGHVSFDSSGKTYLIDASGGLLLQFGQIVSTGSLIGRVGMTGTTTGPHLHWGLKYRGQYIDPALVLEQMYRHGKY